MTPLASLVMHGPPDPAVATHKSTIAWATIRAAALVAVAMLLILVILPAALAAADIA